VPEIATGTSTESVESASPEGTQEPVARTVEEVEAIWKKRVSGKDKAHEAEVNELRRQLELRAAAASAPPATETPEQARIRELEERLKAAEKDKVVAERKARFPRAAEDLGDDIVVVDEARLARLEARLADEESAPETVMASNSARRGGEQPGAPKEKTKDDLLKELAEISPLYEQALRERFS
jgi:hypothetical protein